jgi:prolipoprotein diacylglyceryltransferase
MIALGVMAAVWLAGRRMEKRGVGTRDDMSSIAMIAVPVGIIGARLYHVVTDWQRFENNLGSIVQVWKGGLGIWGGIALGTVAGVWFAKRKGLSVVQPHCLGLLKYLHQPPRLLAMQRALLFIQHFYTNHWLVVRYVLR